MLLYLLWIFNFVLSLNNCLFFPQNNLNSARHSVIYEVMESIVFGVMHEQNVIDGSRAVGPVPVLAV